MQGIKLLEVECHILHTVAEREEGGLSIHTTCRWLPRDTPGPKYYQDICSGRISTLPEI